MSVCACVRVCVRSRTHIRKLTAWQHKRALTSGFELRIFLSHAWLAFFLCEVKSFTKSKQFLNCDGVFIRILFKCVCTANTTQDFF